MGPHTRALVRALKARPFVELLERLSGVAPLRADARNLGGGVHQTEPDGSLSLHFDFEACAWTLPTDDAAAGGGGGCERSIQYPPAPHDAALPPTATVMHRRVNVFVFLNDDWDDAWGGEPPRPIASDAGSGT